MYYSECIQNGKMYYRLTPHGDWIEFTPEMYVQRIIELKHELDKPKEFNLVLSDESGINNTYVIKRSSEDEKKNLNDFILDALQISEDKRKIPFIIHSPNGTEVYPKIKMKFQNFGSSILGDKLESMCVTWND